MAGARLGLGTVQFGLAYGITNQRGQVAVDDVGRILRAAAVAGWRLLDTAAAYGDSEAVLGGQGEAAAPFRIVTKTIQLKATQIGPAEAETVRAGLERSLRLLRRCPLDGVLVHDSADILNPGGERVLDILREAQVRGQVGRIGVSVYDPEELARVLDRFTPDLVQLPFNLFDQRFATTGLLARLKALGCEIHARSLFLQGTLLVEPQALPARLAYARPAFTALADFLAAHGLDRLTACLGCGLARPELDALIMGVTGVDELGAIIAAAATLPAALPDFSRLAVTEETILHPGKWRGLIRGSSAPPEPPRQGP